MIQRRKERLREEFKRIAVKSDILYCLKVFLSIGETIFYNDKNEISINPQTAEKDSILIIDPRRIIIANVGVNWLLEDSLDHLQETLLKFLLKIENQIPPKSKDAFHASRLQYI